MEVVVMNPHPLRDLAARSAHIDHIAESGLVAELVAIHLRVMAGDRQISAIADALEEVAGKADVGRAGPDLVPAGGVGEQESFNLDVGGGAGHVEALRSSDLHAADCLRDDPDWIGRGPLTIDRYRSASCVDAVMHDDDVTGHGAVDTRLQVRKGVNLVGGGEGRSGAHHAGEREACAEKDMSSLHLIFSWVQFLYGLILVGDGDPRAL